MSIIRISWLEDGFYAPDADGNLTTTTSYNRRSRKGKLDPIGSLTKSPFELTKDTSDLAHYVDAMVQNVAEQLPASTAKTAPISIFVHGFQFDPTRMVFADPQHASNENPHGRLYHWQVHPHPIEMKAHSTSWPLGFGYQPDDEGKKGLCIGFGWFSNPDFLGSLFNLGKNFYARAYELADEAALHLIALIEALTRRLPKHKLNLICHSLGSRVVIRCLARMAKERDITDIIGKPENLLPRRTDLIEKIDRVIILAGAEKVMEAQLMMSRLNRTGYADNAIKSIPDFYNFISRENDVLDKLGENFGPNAPGSKQVIGHNGLERLDPSWIDIQLDDPTTAEGLCKLVGDITDRDTGQKRKMRLMGDNQGAFAVGDHWIHYTWPDNMVLYRQILRREDKKLELDALKKATIEGEKGFFNQLRLLRGAD